MIGGFKKDAMTFPTRLVRLGQGDKSKGVVSISLEFHGFNVKKFLSYLKLEEHKLFEF